MSPQVPPANPKTPLPPIEGNMRVVITVSEVTIVIEGPVGKVVAILQWVFSQTSPNQIASLELVFGPEMAGKK